MTPTLAEWVQLTFGCLSLAGAVWWVVRHHVLPERVDVDDSIVAARAVTGRLR